MSRRLELLAEMVSLTIKAHHAPADDVVQRNLQDEFLVRFRDLCHHLGYVAMDEHRAQIYQNFGEFELTELRRLRNQVELLENENKNMSLNLVSEKELRERALVALEGDLRSARTEVELAWQSNNKNVEELARTQRELAEARRVLAETSKKRDEYKEKADIYGRNNVILQQDLEGTEKELEAIKASRVISKTVTLRITGDPSDHKSFKTNLVEIRDR